VKSRASVVLLAVIAAVLVVIAGTLLLRGHESQAEKDARQEAEIYCTLQGVVPGMTGLDDPKYRACVERETETNLGE
jgi:cell division protein FtsN